MRINDDNKVILQKARDTYGTKNQILVSIEELNELAAVCAKYPRYSDENQANSELHFKVLDEVADVYIVLNHIEAILQLSDEEIQNRIAAKIERLERWLNTSQSFQHTMEDRIVKSSESSKEE